MPPRLNKRQQRELEELEALGGPTKPSTGSELALSDDEAVPAKSMGVFSAASFLTPDNDDGDSDDTTEITKKAKKPKKKKKKPAGTDTPSTSEQKLTIVEDTRPSPIATTPVKGVPEAQVTLTASERKALKKAKQKEKRGKGVDDLERTLAELAIQLPPRPNHSQTTSTGHSLADLLGVSLQHLDAEAELRKFFGSRVVQAAKASSPSSPSRRNAGALRSNLTRPRPTWWSASQREGLSIRPLSQHEVQAKLYKRDWEATNEKWWTVEYSKKYKSMTRAFMRTVMSGDPQGFFQLLQKLPWHADTLLQISELCRHREEHAQAVDFIDRALYTYERSFIGAFNLTSGINRLDFDRVENRPFFLAIHRQVVDLQRRGCIRTAFEFARLLYSLEPWTDPHGALLHLDQVAIKANMGQWLIDTYDVFNTSSQQDSKDLRLDPSLLPGWAYSYALALYLLEKGKSSDHSKSTVALTNAIRDFPSVVPLLADKLEADVAAFVRSHPECRIELDVSSMPYNTGILHLLSHLYAQRSSSIWKDHASWFAETVNSTFSSLPNHASPLSPTPRRAAFLSLYAKSGDLRWSVYRHVIVLESTYQRLLSMIPKEVLKEKSFACDPLSPRDAITSYNEEFFEGTEDLFAYRPMTRREQEMDRRRLAQIIPDPGFRQQLQAFFEAQGLQQRFPGGIVQFAQAMAQVPPQELEDLMLNGLLMGEGGADFIADQGLLGAGGMPGQMPGEDMLAGLPDEIIRDPLPGLPGAQAGPVEDHQSDEDEEDEEDEEEDIAPMPRMIRNLLGRLWGRTPAAEESSSSEDEDEAAANLDAVD